MSSKESILGSIRALKLDQKKLPEVPEFPFSGELLVIFKTSIESNKGTFTKAEELVSEIKGGKYARIFSTVSSFQNVSNHQLSDDAHDLKDLDLAILQGQFGVAENGAIWLEDLDLKLRAIPFITQHLVLVLNQEKLVANMHDGYKQIGSAHSGFGLFIAGPSKTADIEQSLVIGAHGARSLQVILS